MKKVDLKENILLTGKSYESLKNRLHALGIPESSLSTCGANYKTLVNFNSPDIIATRIIILFATFYAVLDKDEFDQTKSWLIHEKLWSFLTPNEILFYNHCLESHKVDEFMWNIEKAYILAWSLNLVTSKPSPDDMISDLHYDDLVLNIPLIRESGSKEFLSIQKLRNPLEIFEEIHFNRIIINHINESGIHAKTIDFDAVKARYEILQWMCNTYPNRSENNI